MKKEYNFSQDKHGVIEPIPRGNYQTLINEALKEYIQHHQESIEEVVRRVIREELQNMPELQKVARVTFNYYDYVKIIRGVKMSTETQTLEKIVVQAQQLSPEYRLRLIQRITDTLILSFPRPSKPLQFGKYKSGKLSTLEDFAIAE